MTDMPSPQEEFAKADFADAMLRAMRNKEETLRELIGVIQRQKMVDDGLGNFVKALADGKDRNDQLAQMLLTVVKVVQEQAGALRHLSSIALVYLAGENFTVDAAQVANKLGAGDEALKELFRQKMGENS